MYVRPSGTDFIVGSGESDISLNRWRIRALFGDDCSRNWELRPRAGAALTMSSMIKVSSVQELVVSYHSTTFFRSTIVDAIV